MQPYNAIPPSFCLQSKKHGVREIVVSALREQPGNTDFEAMSTKTPLRFIDKFLYKNHF
jgi:hypothetical protein